MSQFRILLELNCFFSWLYWCCYFCYLSEPTVTGAAVLGIKYKGGTMIMCDTLASYGSMARFKDCERIMKVNENVVVGVGGEFSDFQHLQKLLREITIMDFNDDDGATKSGKEIHSFLSRVLYNRRCKQNPLWNEVVTGGFENGEAFLGYVDLYGSNFVSEDTVCTGFGSYMAAPILRNGFKPDMEEAEAKALLEKAMTVLVYRHCRTINKFQVGIVTKDGVKISDPYVLPTFWEHSRFINPHMA